MSKVKTALKTVGLSASVIAVTTFPAHAALDAGVVTAMGEATGDIAALGALGLTAFIAAKVFGLIKLAA